MQELQHIMENNNLNPNLLIGTTPILAHEAPETFCRGDEIKQWLEENDWSSYVIIDDIPASNFLKEQEPHLVIVNPKEGLAKKEAMLTAANILDDNFVE